MKTKNINTKPLLPFKTITEEAMFWDKHSFADYELKYRYPRVNPWYLIPSVQIKM